MSTFLPLIKRITSGSVVPLNSIISLSIFVIFTKSVSSLGGVVSITIGCGAEEFSKPNSSI
jgi:hypothetical protein